MLFIQLDCCIPLSNYIKPLINQDIQKPYIIIKIKVRDIYLINSVEHNSSYHI